MDFNNIYDAGNYEAGQTTAVIEISKYSNLKIEFNRHKKAFELDRIEPDIFLKPVNYGFIPRTLDDDGDELDILVLCAEKLPMGLVVNCEIIGVMIFEDDGEMDHKILAVPADNRNNGNAVKNLDDLYPQMIKQLEHHFTHYKDLKKPGSTIVKGFEGVEKAKEIIKECIDRWNSEEKK